MSRWAAGQAEIHEMLATDQLEHIAGDQANGERLLQRAQRTLSTAAGLIASDPASAYVLAYDGARYVCTALLAQQGLRPTSRGGHYAVERAVRAQFGAGFRPFGTLRRRRNELEYPGAVDEEADVGEAEEAVSAANALLHAAARLLPNLDLS